MTRYLCTNCDGVFKTRDSLRKHIRSCGEDRIVCPVRDCDKSFTTQRRLKEHWLPAHGGDPHPHKCGCGKTFTYPNKLQFHAKNCPQSKPLIIATFPSYDEMVRRSKKL